MAPSDRYKDLQLVQKTPTGDIYRARHIVLGRPVLIRTIDTSLEEAELTVIHESVRRTSRLVHPNILSVIDAELDGSSCFYVTDYVIGSLKERMSDAPFAVDTVARWGLQLLRGIAHANAHDVIHRGLSPWRIHFDQVGSILIADFGLAAAMQDRSTGTIAIEVDATPYLPVRVLRSPAAYDEQADRYGVAALVTEILIGSVPETGSLDVSSAAGDVPTYIVSALELLLTGEATAEDLDAAIRAFKRWVDGLASETSMTDIQPLEAKSTPSVSGDDREPATTGERAPKTGPAGGNTRRRRRTASQAQPKPKAKPKAKPKPKPKPTTKAKPAPTPPAKTRRERPDTLAVPPSLETTDVKPPAPTAPEDDPPAEDTADRVQDKLDRYAHLFD